MLSSWRFSISARIGREIIGQQRVGRTGHGHRTYMMPFRATAVPFT